MCNLYNLQVEHVNSMFCMKLIANKLTCGDENTYTQKIVKLQPPNNKLRKTTCFKKKCKKYSILRWQNFFFFF